MAPSKPVETFAVLPDPGDAGSLDEFVERLRSLKIWAGNPSYEVITDRINAAWTAAGRSAGELARRGTVVDCFKFGRRRVNTDLMIAVVESLHPDAGYVAQWRQALRVVSGETRAAAQVRAQDTLPDDLAEFTGRRAELDQLRNVLRRRTAEGGAVVISAIEGMAGVGKTQLAIHAGHVLGADEPFEHVLFVDLRGFHPDPAQPPADPAAVLDSFLRLLGVPGQQIPHDLAARTALYRRRLAGRHALVVLDNAADEDQVRPLLPGGPGCLTLVTSRHNLTGLHPAAHLSVDVFTPHEALDFLARAVPDVPVGDDPDALARVTRRCGHLPLALGLVAGHMRAKAGWTVTDHADWLDERHRNQRLDTGVELALSLSYQHLPADRRRLLRLLAIHPGHHIDTYAAAALTDTDLDAAGLRLRRLAADHLLQQAGPGRFVFHDLVRAYAATRAGDEDRPPERRAALSRLFDYYLYTAACAMDTLHPAETTRRPRIPVPRTPTPALTDPDAARAWLDTERPTLVAVAAHTAAHGWPTHTTRLSTTLFRYLNSGHHGDALTVHSNAQHAAHLVGEPTGQAMALNNLGTTYLQLGQHRRAAEHFQRALRLFRQMDDPAGQARTLNNLGVIEQRLGHYRAAADRLLEALALNRQTGNRSGEAGALNNLGEVEIRLGRHQGAAEHLQQALTLCRQLGNRAGEAWTLDSLGTLHIHLDQPSQATRHHRQAVAIFRETGDQDGETWALNGLGEAAHTAGQPADAVTHHTAALTIATDIGNRYQQARAHTGLGHAHRTLDQPARARQHYEAALALYTDLDVPEADQLRADLATVDDRSVSP